MSIYAHQKKILEDDKPKAGIFLGTGSGKTRIACLLAKGNTLVIAPKIQYVDENWPKELKKLGISLPLTVISKETFRRDWKNLPYFETVIVDEAHTVAGVTPSTRRREGKEVPKASQLFEALQMFLVKHKPPRLYLLTATPARNPMAVWALAKLLGRKWDFYEFRATFYIRLKSAGWREIYMPKKDKASKERLAKAVRSLGYVGRLEDWFDVPEQTTKHIHCPLTPYQKEFMDSLYLEYPDPLVLVGKMHQAEQGCLLPLEEGRKSAKLAAIDDLLEEFPKVLIFARYTGQIKAIEAHLKAQKIECYTLTGETKERKKLIADANASPRCAFIAQSQISTGYELPSFRCTVFASASYSSVDHTQALGRTLRANALNKNLYVYLHSGEVDKAVLKCLANHQDFDEKLFAEQHFT